MNIGQGLVNIVERVIDQPTKNNIREEFDRGVRKLVTSQLGDHEGKSAQKAANDQKLVDYINDKFSYHVDISAEAQQQQLVEQETQTTNPAGALEAKPEL